LFVQAQGYIGLQTESLFLPCLFLTTVNCVKTVLEKKRSSGGDGGGGDGGGCGGTAVTSSKKKKGEYYCVLCSYHAFLL